MSAESQENQDIAARAEAASSAADTDRYFLEAWHRQKKQPKRRKASRATLASLPNRPDQEAAHLLAQQHMDQVARNSSTALAYTDRFPEWARQLRVGGFSLLFYGAGSKRRLLRGFQAACLAEELCVEIDGYHPDASPKAVFGAILDEIVGGGGPPGGGGRSLAEVARCVAVELEKTDIVLYLVIHGLDGPQLRTDKAAEALAALVGSPSVRMAASVDHRLCQLLWDRAQLTRMACLWCHAPTWLPYLEELPQTAPSTGRAVSAGLAAGAGGSGEAALQLSGLRHLMASLTANAKELFVLLARRQLETGPGVAWPLDELYWACLDRMLVTSELTLHAHLKEFRDHGLVRLKSGGGKAGDTGVVALPPDTLQQFLAAFGDDGEG